MFFWVFVLDNDKTEGEIESCKNVITRRVVFYGTIHGRSTLRVRGSKSYG